MNLLRLSVIAFAGCLAACGGGGGSSSSPIGGSTPTPVTTAAPLSVSGHVMQLAGPLSSSTWNLAPPANCPSAASGQNCASYPTAPPALPNASATVVAGAGVGGVTIYVTTAAAVLTSAIPSAPIASGTTASDGSFSIALPSGTSGTVGLLAIDGTSIGANGATNLGFTIAHQIATAGSAGTTLFIDTLSGDEQSAFGAVNAVRSASSLAPVAADTIAQATARLSVVQSVGASTCTFFAGAGTAYGSFGGYFPNSAHVWEDTAGTQWSFAELGATSNDSLLQPLAYAGLAALYKVAPCGTGFGSTPVNYFEGFFVL